jgi:hypothetical protein
MFVALSGVTVNELDNRETYLKWKMYCGAISAQFTDLVQAWNDEAIAEFAIPDDVIKSLQAYTKAVQKAEGNVKLIEKLNEKYGDALVIEEETRKKLDEAFNVEVEVEIDGLFPKEEVPLNVNGAYLNEIKEFLK